MGVLHYDCATQRKWSLRRVTIPLPPAYHAGALPIELRRRSGTQPPDFYQSWVLQFRAQHGYEPCFEISCRCISWSERPAMIRQPDAWKAPALPIELRSQKSILGTHRMRRKCFDDPGFGVYQSLTLFLLQPIEPLVITRYRRQNLVSHAEDSVGIAAVWELVPDGWFRRSIVSGELRVADSSIRVLNLNRNAHRRYRRRRTRFFAQHEVYDSFRVICEPAHVLNTGGPSGSRTLRYSFADCAVRSLGHGPEIQSKNGAYGRLRSDDLQFTKLTLYQLSYAGRNSNNSDGFAVDDVGQEVRDNAEACQI